MSGVKVKLGECWSSIEEFSSTEKIIDALKREVTAAREMRDNLTSVKAVPGKRFTAEYKEIYDKIRKENEDKGI